MYMNIYTYVFAANIHMYLQLGRTTELRRRNELHMQIRMYIDMYISIYIIYRQTHTYVYVHIII